MDQRVLGGAFGEVSIRCRGALRSLRGSATRAEIWRVVAELSCDSSRPLEVVGSSIMAPTGETAVVTPELPPPADTAISEALACAITPDEDVEGYMRKFLLPALTPALEALLHVVVERGELSLEKEGSDAAGAKKGDPEKEKGGRPGAEEKQRGGAEKVGDEKKKKKKEKPGALENQDEESIPAGSEAGDEAEGGKDKFNPLLWFAEKLRESAKGRQYKELFEKRMEERRRKREEEVQAAAEAKAIEEAKAAEEAAAAEQATTAAEPAAEGEQAVEEQKPEA